MPELDGEYADTLLAAALRYAAGGLYVFPAYVERPDPTQHAKTARFIGQWRTASSKEPAQIRAWWGPDGPWRGAHVCVDTGKSGLVVLDADGPDAIAAVEQLIALADCGPAVETTPTGGAHYWFRESYRDVIGNSASLVAADVDVRGMGGLVYAAPSRDSAGAYRWVGSEPDFAEHDALPVVPQVIIDRTKAQVKAEGSHANPDANPANPPEPAPFDVPARQFTKQQAFDFCAPFIRALREAPVGTINARLNDAAKAISHFIPAFWAAETVSASLLAALEHTAYDGATWRAQDTIASAFRSAGADWRAELLPDPFEDGQQAAPPEASVVDAFLAELLTPEELVAMPPPMPLIMDWLDLDSLAYVIGKPGSYKSFLVLDWAAHVGQGLPWRGHRVEQADCWYVVAEGTSGMSLRVRAWEDRNGPMKGVSFLPRPVQASGGEWTVMVEAARQRQPKLIILDTQARVTVGMDENDNTEMGKFIHRAEELRAATGACVLVVHHIGRNGEDARGASALDGAQTTEIKIKRSDRGPGWAVIEQDKQKDMAEAEPIEIQLDTVDLGLDAASGRRLSSLVLAPVNPFDTAGSRMPVQDWLENLTENQGELLGVARDIFTGLGATKAELRTAVRARRDDRNAPDMPKNSFYKAFDHLVSNGAIVRVKGTQRYVFDDTHSDVKTSLGRANDRSDIDDHRGDLTG